MTEVCERCFTTVKESKETPHTVKTVICLDCQSELNQQPLRGYGELYVLRSNDI